MDEHSSQNQNHNEQDNLQTQPSDSPYAANQDHQYREGTPLGQGINTEQPQYSQPGQQQWNNGQQENQPYWQNGPQNNHQNSYPQWQNGPQDQQQYWQNEPQNNQQYWQNGQQGNQQYWQNGQPPKQRNNLALASMIFGIFSLLTCCVPFIQFPLAVISIVLVILSKKKQPLTGFAIAGLVMGIISIVISILMTVYWGYVISFMNDPEFMDLYNDMMQMYH